MRLQAGLYVDVMADIVRSAIRSRNSLCRHMVTPPVGHERTCSMEKVVPHTHSLGRSGGIIVPEAQCIPEITLVESKFMGHDGYCCQLAVGALFTA